MTPSAFEAQYKLDPVLGYGGSSTVYAASRLKDDADVVAKFIPLKRVPQWDYVKRIPMEITMLERVASIPGVIHLLDWFFEADCFILVLERVEASCDLYDYINGQRGGLAEAVARRLLRQLVRTVAACHKAGVLHRDLKDENVVVNTNTLQVKLLDFGAAAFLDADRDDFDNIEDFSGTRVYCPPEFIAFGEYHGLPAAVWSLGCLLYAMVFGCVAFDNDRDILAGELYFPKPVSAELQDLLRRCLAYKVADRLAFADLASLSHPWLRTPPPSDNDARRRYQRRAMTQVYIRPKQALKQRSKEH